ncbi:MAG: GNAT family N-acetyltransferase [Pseudomonadota bacterium]
MNLSEFEFRFAGKQDGAALAELMLEANRYYWGEADGAAEMTSKAADVLVNSRSGCRAVVACDAGVLKGFATVSVLHPAPNESGTLFMKDLFVSKDARGSGLGKLFMQHLAKHAVELGYHRFDWTAETDNPRAIAFYDELNASRVEEKVYFRLSDTELRAFADNSKD